MRRQFGTLDRAAWLRCLGLSLKRRGGGGGGGGDGGGGIVMMNDMFSYVYDIPYRNMLSPNMNLISSNLD